MISAMTPTAKRVIIGVFILIPFAFVVGLMQTFAALNIKFSISVLVAVNLLLICFLLLLLKVEDASDLPLNVGKLVVGPPYIISLCGTLFLVFVFLLALNKAVELL